MKTVLCIVDGMTDAGFQVSQMPALLHMANEGCSGWLNTTPKGLMPDTLPCVSSILGLSEDEVKTVGRGFVEALGSDIPMKKGDRVYRVSWLNLDKDKNVLGFCITPPKTKTIEGTSYFPLNKYAGILLVHATGSSGDAVTPTTPPHMLFGQQLDRLMPKGDPILESFSLANFSNEHIPIPWGGGFVGQMPSTLQPVAMITATQVVIGISKMLGMVFMRGDGSTGDVDTDLRQKYEICLDALSKYDLVVLHLGGADEAAHRKNRAEKASFLRAVNDIVLQPLLEQNIQLAACSDHSTDPETGHHGSEPQPFFINGHCRSSIKDPISGAELAKLLGIEPQRLSRA